MSSRSVRTTSAPKCRRGVAAVQEAVNRDGRYTVPDAELDAGKEVTVEGVDTTRAEQPDEMQRAAGCAQLGAELDQRRELVKLTALDALRDADQVLRHDAAGAEVEVAHLAVAHLALGEADGQPARVEESVRERAPEPVPYRGVGQFDRVAFAFRPIAPAVQNDQDDPAPGRTV